MHTLVKQIVLLSGPVGSGKTTLCQQLEERFGLISFRTKDYLRLRGERLKLERGSLQRFGDKLDRETKGTWVRDALARLVNDLDEEVTVLVDAVRIENQVEAIRQAYGPRVFHLHLTAPDEVLSARYYSRKTDVKEMKSYEEVRKNRTEKQIEQLAQIADVVIDTKRCTELDVFVKAASHLGLYGREYLRLVDVLVGGQFGSEGKGNIVSYLAREYDVLVRVGGPNAGHKVYEEPDPYTFHHLPSGSRCHGEAQIVIGPGAVLYVPKLLEEIADCRIDSTRLSIDAQAMIITEHDKQMEKQLVQDIGSTGQGVGAATSRRIMQRNTDPAKLARDIPELRPYIKQTREVLEEAFCNRKRVFLEGTQGTGLSLYHGHYPHVTSRDTTVAGCLAEAGISPSRVRKVVMVCRTYPIRVQSPGGQGRTSGPMSQEITLQEIAKRSGIDLEELNKTETTSTTKRKRRIGEFDWALLRKAASLNAPTDIALTFADYVSIKNRDARRFEQLTPETIQFIQEIERVSAAPVSLISTRFHSRSIIDRRSW
jgi:adenylosuccinate synthase